MHEKLDAAMTEAVVDSFENMAFMEVEECHPEGGEEVSSGGAYARSSLLINEPLHGIITLSMPRELLVSLAETIYNLAPCDISEDMLHDTVAEFVNTIAGRFLTAYLFSGVTYSMGIPEEDVHADFLEGQFARKWYFSVGGHLAHIVLAGDGFGDQGEKTEQPTKYEE